jgi:hypothetical protein
MPLTIAEREHVRQTIAFYRGPNKADDDQTALRDLLTDLMHYAKEQGLRFCDAEEGAREVFLEEQEQPEEE